MSKQKIIKDLKNNVIIFETLYNCLSQAVNLIMDILPPAGLNQPYRVEYIIDREKMQKNLRIVSNNFTCKLTDVLICCKELINKLEDKKQNKLFNNFFHGFFYKYKEEKKFLLLLKYDIKPECIIQANKIIYSYAYSFTLIRKKYHFLNNQELFRRISCIESCYLSIKELRVI